ncbi:MAG TPA: type II secretion system minor pseudopilin GspI [Woeseiaceae bacterium]|jgi:general secretion pathway protein I|nr:type II secretion system minor pseudopilin GspI [Woeseiaceae bacterium]
MNRRRSDRRRSAGFTLLEVMVALGIAALSLTAVTAAMSQMVDAASSMRERTYASWIAQNKIAEMRLSNVVPDVSEDSGEVEFAGLEWTWRSTVSETGVENLFRVDVAVSFVDSEAIIRSVTGFIGEPGIPGQSNIAWTTNLPAGEER